MSICSFTTEEHETQERGFEGCSCHDRHIVCDYTGMKSLG